MKIILGWREQGGTELAELSRTELGRTELGGTELERTELSSANESVSRPNYLLNGL